MSTKTNSEPRIRPSKAGPWRTAVLVGVHLLFALHLAHLYSTGSSLTPLEPSESMEFSKLTVINAGLIFFGLLILSTLLLGRWFCGWGCHIVALQDACRWLMLKFGITPKPLRSRLLAFVPLLAALYMFFLPAIARIGSGQGMGEPSLHLTNDAAGFWDTFPGLGVSIATFLVCGFAAVYVLGAKGFCTYGCPYGALFGVADRLAPGRIRVTDACEGCGHCTQVCSSNVAVSREVHEYGMVVDAGCMKCMDCVSVCPTDALYFGMGKPALLARPRNERKPRRPQLGWGEELFVGLVFLGALLASRGLWITDRERIPFLMALGVAGCVAGLAFVLLRLVTRPKVSLQNLRLKEGSLTGTGKLVAGLIALLLVLVAQSGYVRWLDGRAETLAGELQGWQAAWFAPDRGAPDAETRGRMEELQQRSRQLRAASLFESPLNAGRLAWANLWLGEEQQVDQLVDEGLERWSANASLHFLRGQRALAGQDMDQAATGLQEAARLRPDLVPYAIAAADVALRTGHPDEAIALIEETLALHPGQGVLSAMRTEILIATGRREEAREAVAGMLASDPGNLPARQNLAALWFRHAEIDEALELLKEGTRIAPESADAFGTLADAALSAGRLQEADAAIRRALQLEPGRPDLLRVAAGVDAALGR